jgi:two-component system phosphate regulon sensor histidine kinase PhoR
MAQLSTDRSLDREIEERERHLAELRRQLGDHERVTLSLRSALDDNERTIALLKKSITEQELTLHAVREATLERERELVALQEQLAKHETTSSYRVALALTLANAAYDALMVVNESFQIIAINDAAERLFNVTSALGRSLVEVTGKPELQSMVEDAVANEEETLEEQITIDRRSYRVKVSVNRREGNFYISLALQDVTELVRLNRARRDMVANISHELRTPIANIRLIIDSLFHEQEKPKRKQSTSALRAIARETDSLLWLVQELLDLSMIESGQAILRMVELPLREIVAEAIERMEDQSETKGIVFVNQVSDGLHVWADHDQIRRVFVNLMHNAIKWSPVGGTVTITAEPRSDDVVVSIRDHGPGVPDELTERIFERFYQVDAARTRGEGTGLGLAICKHIVEAHGGRIWAEGNQGGTRGGWFSFTLGLADIEAEEPQETDGL